MKNKKQKTDTRVLTDIVSLSKKAILSQKSLLSGADCKGLIFYSDKSHLLVPKTEIPSFLNQPVKLFLSQYELIFYGIVKSVKAVQRRGFEICVDFTENTPFYYRECVADLLN